MIKRTMAFSALVGIAFATQSVLLSLNEKPKSSALS